VTGYLPVILILVVGMWLFVIRPQRRRQHEQQRMLDGMRPGAEVITAGGLYGTIRSVDEDEVLVEIAPGVDVRVAKQAIATVLTEEDAQLAELERAQHEAEAESLASGDRGRR
jgi:preprotein translocase subunit YajC